MPEVQKDLSLGPRDYFSFYFVNQKILVKSLSRFKAEGTTSFYRFLVQRKVSSL